MTINTKFNVGDELWILAHDNQPICCKVKGVHIEVESYGVNEDATPIVYYILSQYNNNMRYKIPAPRVFSTKEELIASL